MSKKANLNIQESGEGIPSNPSGRNFHKTTILNTETLIGYAEGIKESGRGSSNSKYRTLFWQIGRDRRGYNCQGRHNINEAKDDGCLGKTQSIGYELFDNLKAILKKLQDLKVSTNQQLKSIVSDQLVTELSDHHQPFKRLDLSLLESILLIGKVQILAQNEEITQVNNHICFLLLGTIKLFNKDYKYHARSGSIFGSEPKLFGISAELRGRAVEESCLLMVPLQSFRMIRERLVKSNLKSDFQLLESLIRLNFIQKHFPSGWKTK